MTVKLKSTKSFFHLACAHAQFFDRNEDGTPGPRASFRGYDRSVHLEFSGVPDVNGDLVPLGGLAAVRQFVEYYLDHTSLIGANDPRIDAALAARDSGLLATLRVLPHGVSMEMTSVFFWAQINPHIVRITAGRCHLSRIETREHENNSAFFEVSPMIGFAQGEKARPDEMLVQKPIWKFIEPQHAIAYIESNNPYRD